MDLNKRNEWVITWIHLSSFWIPIYEQYHDGIKTFGHLNMEEFDGLLTYKNKKHIVFLDGYLTIDSYKYIMSECQRWLEDNRTQNKLVIICSMESIGYIDIDDEKGYKIKDLFITSWSIQENYDAVNSNEFFESVKDCLGSPIISQGDTKELINSKFNFAQVFQIYVRA